MGKSHLTSVAKLLRLIVFVAAWPVCHSALPAAERRPNILLLFTDDQPQSCLGIMGNKHIHASRSRG